MSIELAIAFLFPALMVFAGAMDVFTMTIPNKVPLALIVAFACLVPFTGLGWEAVALHVCVAFAMLVVGIGMFAMGWMGGGDAKLLAAAALWMGPGHIYEYAMVAALVGGALTIIMVLLRTLPLPAGLAGSEWVARLHDAGSGVPYGVALAAGGILVYPHVGWVQQLQ